MRFLIIGYTVLRNSNIQNARFLFEAEIPKQLDPTQRISGQEMRA